MTAQDVSMLVNVVSTCATYLLMVYIISLEGIQEEPVVPPVEEMEVAHDFG